jgi:hypothetical protein
MCCPMLCHIEQDHSPALCCIAHDHGPALAQDFFAQYLYGDEYVWSRAMPHSAGKNCIALDKLVKLSTHAV